VRSESQFRSKSASSWKPQELSLDVKVFVLLAIGCGLNGSYKATHCQHAEVLQKTTRVEMKASGNFPNRTGAG